jgi:Toprim domain
MTAFAFAELHDLMAGRFGAVDTPCPLCGPSRQHAVNQRRKTLRLWCDDPEFISFHCVRCEQRGWASASRIARAPARAVDAVKILAEVQQRDHDETQERLSKALGLWRRRVPIAKSPAETYLREVRCYRGELPATLGFLPASAGFAPAMIAAFGMASEGAPGEIIIDESAIRGVHLTSLKPDGRGKAGTDRDKIMVGKSAGSPIVLAAVNDGLGLAITEGIEDGLSVHEASGLGAWAAGAASRLLAVAGIIPAYVECVNVVADADAAGRANAEKLAVAIALQGREIRLIVPPQIQSRSAAA